MVNAHAINDRARLVSHEIYATHIRQDPSLIERARDQVTRALSAETTCLTDRCWSVVLQEDVETIIRVMLDEGAIGRLLRSGSPFPLVIDVLDEELRRQLWAKAKSELLAEDLRSADIPSKAGQA